MKAPSVALTNDGSWRLQTLPKAFFFVKQQQLVESLKVSLWIFIFLQFLLTPLSQFFATIPKGIQGQNIGCTQSLSNKVLQMVLWQAFWTHILEVGGSNHSAGNI